MLSWTFAILACGEAVIATIYVGHSGFVASRRVLMGLSRVMKIENSLIPFHMTGFG